MIRLIIADDHPVVREGLKKILEKTGDMFVIGEAASGEELIEVVSSKDCDVVLLDISMPGRGGLEVLDDVIRLKPHLPVLVLSIHPEEFYGIRVLKSGAAGFMNKENAPDELIIAIRKVSTGGRYVSASLAERLACELGPGTNDEPREVLSNREFQVMCLIASGKTVSDISRELSLSVRTISTYRARVMSKMDFHNNSDLIHYAVKNNLVD